MFTVNVLVLATADPRQKWWAVMGEPVTGQWGRIYTAPFSGAAKWGTGVHPIHSQYGSDALRITGRYGTITEVQSGLRTAPSAADMQMMELGEPWGYMPEDIAGLDVFQLSDYAANRHGLDIVNDTDHPEWGQTTTVIRQDTAPKMRPPWGIPGRLTTGRIRAGQWDADFEVSDQVPTETVSEGWLNKPASGKGMGYSGDDVIVSDPSQYEIQTSMIQRHATQNNQRALLRGTDCAREPIASRIAPMKLKVYSGQQRHYDMDPRQLDDMPRAFWYRRAGTGRVEEMDPNEMYVVTPLQRTPPPDPSLGPPESSLSDPNYDPDFGYTDEDQGWF